MLQPTGHAQDASSAPTGFSVWRSGPGRRRAALVPGRGGRGCFGWPSCVFDQQVGGATISSAFTARRPPSTGRYRHRRRRGELDDHQSEQCSAQFGRGRRPASDQRDHHHHKGDKHEQRAEQPVRAKVVALNFLLCTIGKAPGQPGRTEGRSALRTNGRGHRGADGERAWISRAPTKLPKVPIPAETQSRLPHAARPRIPMGFPNEYFLRRVL
jgi:hypothetical protein